MLICKMSAKWRVRTHGYRKLGMHQFADKAPQNTYS